MVLLVGSERAGADGRCGGGAVLRRRCAPAGSGSSSRQRHQAVGSTGDLRARAMREYVKPAQLACSVVALGARMNALPIQWGNFPFHTHDTVKSELGRNVQICLIPTLDYSKG